MKSKERLLAALTYVEYLRDHQVPMLMADDEHELRQAHETANMVLNAEMKLRASAHADREPRQPLPGGLSRPE